MKHFLKDSAMQPFEPLNITRRHFFSRTAQGLGTLALASLGLGKSIADITPRSSGGLPDLPHVAPKAKRVIYLFQSGAPSQIDLYDPKPVLV